MRQMKVKSISISVIFFDGTLKRFNVKYKEFQKLLQKFDELYGFKDSNFSNLE